MATLKELAARQERISGGHRACAGCLPMVTLKMVMRATDYPIIATCATGCMEVVTTIYPFTAWRTPFMHNAFENSAATISGVEAAYRALKKRKRLPVDKDIKFIGFGGDGGTYDIGIQALSGAMERRHDMLYVCYNNEAYMNTGIQRSGATPFGAYTNTAPAGSHSDGKDVFSKDLTEIMVSHHLPFVAQASPHNWKDLQKKVEKALTVKGPTFINVIAPCPLGWRYPAEKGVEVAKLAVDTCFWPLYEVENGVYKINYKPKEKVPIREYTKLQGRFRHLKGEKGDEIHKIFQEEIDRRWERLLKLEEITKQ